MKGLEKFKEYFQGYENYYVIIGGTACVLLNEEVFLCKTLYIDRKI